MKKNTFLFSLFFLVLLSQTSFGKDKETNLLILLHSQNGSTLKLAQGIAQGILLYPNTKVVIKRVPSLDSKMVLSSDVQKLPIATIEELAIYDGIAFGSPVHFGNISADMAAFFAKSIPLWTTRALEGKPATVFMSSGSGSGNEVAIQCFWSTVALHGMVIIPTGIMASDMLDKTIAQGNTPFGATSITGATGPRPSESELALAKEQGRALARTASALKIFSTSKISENVLSTEKEWDVNQTLVKLGIVIPKAPNPVGNYVPYVISNNVVYINQVALKDGKILYPGKIGTNEITDEQAKEATKQAFLNVVSVLKEACGGDLNRVKRVVQLTGYFNTSANYTQHAAIMNTASDLAVGIFGDKGKHARATIGAVSLPINASVEIQAIFEIE
ncbi:NAD(P)H:quinone oxidoreductase [Flavobacterium sp. XN-5]|uniref:NAD(P)H:quinone oxidoreductase n=1 Tax=Flavobacterium sp. XN-5 TaxID=2599390 RepID=UPI0011CAEDBF|nr:NAD(P)H:quinone oxidoreductase [Flavobacterium sp. XN-5]NGY37941.1 NAD(P)H:quinone oxidoreductase [Flavobacterium sp. XN-5]